MLGFKFEFVAKNDSLINKTYREDPIYQSPV
ncbi:hypothetical protein M2263_002459 [Providencia alcalifaciens]|nr:hypothetical protein [Providencia alcalifaciens]